MQRSPASAAKSPAKLGLVGGLLYSLLVLAALCIALYGVWVATSLAVYHDGPVWLAVVGAIACFFLLPLVWELVADRHQKGGRIRDAILRSSFLALAFLAVLVLTHPATAFKALATRGDWFLGGSTSASAQSLRAVLGTLAGGLEGLYNLTRSDTFDDDADNKAIAPSPQASVVTDAPGTATASKPTPTTITPAPGLPIAGSSLVWPLPETPHACLALIPEAARSSIDALGGYFAAAVPDLFERTKAVHDFVATTISYDAPLLMRLRDGADYPRITAPEVLATRTSICEGYSILLIAIGKAAGLHIVRVAGDTRSISDYQGLPGSDAEPVLPSLGHTWNAVEIGLRWYLLDATFDAGYLRDGAFVPQYSTAYLFTPPEVMALTHFPKDEKWQLREAPLSRAAWLRMPLVRPDFMAQGLALRDPTRPAITARNKVSVQLDNPRGIPLGLWLTTPDGKQSPFCGTSSDPSATLSCDLTTHGRYTAHIGARTDPKSRSYRSLGAILVDASP